MDDEPLPAYAAYGEDDPEDAAVASIYGPGQYRDWQHADALIERDKAMCDALHVRHAIEDALARMWERQAMIDVEAAVGEVLYRVREIVCEIGGRGFIVAKVGDPESEYQVRAGTPEESDCTCLGFLRWGRCKHLSLVRRLMRGGVRQRSRNSTRRTH